MADLRKRRIFLAAAGLVVASAAYASPWDIDMINGYSFKAFEWRMRQAPAASVQRQPEGPRGVGAYQTAWVAQVDRANAAQVDALANPFPADEARLAEGKRLCQVTCAPCHGVEGKGGGPVTNHNPAKGLNRFPLPAPVLSGAGAVSAVRSDGYIYATIRNGGALMPAYGVSLTEQERWSIVSYIRTLDGAKYNAPAAPADSTATPAAPSAAPADSTGGTPK